MLQRVSSQILLIGLPGFLDDGRVVAGIEELGLGGGFEGGPVAADDAVTGDDGLEDATIVVGAVAVLGREDDVAALVADEVFIVGRNQEVTALAEASRAAVVGEVEIAVFPFHRVNRVAQQRDAPAAVADVQS